MVIVHIVDISQNIIWSHIVAISEDPLSPERMCSIMGPKDGVDQAVRRIHEIIHNVQERDGIVGGVKVVSLLFYTI